MQGPDSDKNLSLTFFASSDMFRCPAGRIVSQHSDLWENFRADATQDGFSKVAELATERVTAASGKGQEMMDFASCLLGPGQIEVSGLVFVNHPSA